MIGTNATRDSIEKSDFKLSFYKYTIKRHHSRISVDGKITQPAGKPGTAIFEHFQDFLFVELVSKLGIFTKTQWSQTMMRLLLFLLFLLPGLSSFGQDVLVLRNTTEINIRLIGITGSDVKYKLYDSKENKVLSVRKSDVFMIKKENGEKIVFAESESSAIPSPTAAKIQAASFLGLNLGLSVPIGIYGQKDDEEAGFADAGSTFNIEGTYFFPSNVGLGFVWGAYANPTDVDALADFGQLDSSGLQYNLTSGPWATGYILLGPTIAVPLEPIFLDFRLYIGTVTTTEPEFELVIFDGNDEIRVVGDQGIGTAIGFMPGIGIRAPLFNDRLALKLNLDVVIAQPEIETSTSYYLNNALVSFETGTYKQKVNSINIAGGLVYQFKRKN